MHASLMVGPHKMSVGIDFCDKIMHKCTTMAVLVFYKRSFEGGNFKYVIRIDG